MTLRSRFPQLDSRPENGIAADARESVRSRSTASAEQGSPGVSRRLGGTVWVPGLSLPQDEFAASRPLPAPVPRRRRTKKRRRPWFRRPAVLAPLSLLVVFLGFAGAVVLRLESTFEQVRSVSTPPPVVTIAAEAGQAEVAIDTGPARAALADAGEAAVEDGGLFGRIQDGAANVTDLAGGAAAAAGISEPDAGAMTILLMGVDARPGAPIDVGVKSDVLIVLRLDPSAGTCRALSIPRDTRVELPGYGLSKINHALLVGGIPYQLMVVEGLLGIELDHYALVDFAAFSEVVDSFGGVAVEVPETLLDGEGAVLFEAGSQTMDGAEALAYVRYRHEPDGDIGRIGRQWAVLRALGEAASGRDLVRDVGTVLPAVEDHVRTDLTPEELTALARALGGRCTADTVEPAVLAGTRVRLVDPILKQSVYFNLVDEAFIQEQVAALLGE